MPSIAAMNRFRPLFAFALVLALSVASVTMAVARGQDAPAGTMVICAGYGVVTLALDAEGNPVGPVHPCPDCLAAHLAIEAPTVPATQRPATRSSHVVLADPALARSRSAPSAHARGPPLSA